jgi:hypothetical protein
MPKQNMANLAVNIAHSPKNVGSNNNSPVDSPKVSMMASSQAQFF